MLRLENGKANYHRQIIINIKEIVGVAGSLGGGIGSSDNNCWADVARSLESLGLGNHQRVKVRHERISVQQCGCCMSALSQSLHSMTLELAPATEVPSRSRPMFYVDSLGCVGTWPSSSHGCLRVTVIVWHRIG